MTDTLKPLTSAELADLKAKAKAASDTAVALGRSGNYIPENIYDAVVFADREFRTATNPETILRLIDMIERRDEWQSIETAPKDGQHLLLWDSKKEVAVSGHWHVNHGTDTPNGYEPAWSWWVSDDDVIVWDGGPDDAPTHWRPLPAPPSEARAARG